MEGTPTWRARSTCSRVWAIGPSGADDDQDGTVDLGRAGDHVFDVVGVAGHVDVGVVAVVRLVLDVRDVDRDAALAAPPAPCRSASKAVKELCLGSSSVSTFVMAAVRVVLPWSMWPIVPMLRWGFVRSNFCLAIDNCSLCKSGPRPEAV